MYEKLHKGLQFEIKCFELINFTYLDQIEVFEHCYLRQPLKASLHHHLTKK